MLGELITSKTRLRLLIKFFVSQANKGHLNGLANEMGESTNGIRKELNHLEHAGYLKKLKVNDFVLMNGDTLFDIDIKVLINSLDSKKIGINALTKNINQKFQLQKRSGKS